MKNDCQKFLANCFRSQHSATSNTAVRGGPAIIVGVTLALACVSFAVQAQGFEDDFDNVEKRWQEVEVQLPAVPADKDLLPFYAGPAATQSFTVDEKSISVGADGVIRYTLVATSAAGTRNVSYEGIRCRTFEKKLYAFGHADGHWSRSRRDQWERITTGGVNSPHARLAQDYFCQNLTVAGSSDDMVERIRDGRTLTNWMYR